MITPQPRRLVLQWWVILFVASALVVGLTLDRTMQRIDNLLYDHLLPAIGAGAGAGAKGTTPPLLLVEIDDASIARLGRWPWPRDLHASLIARLHEAGARSIAYDVLFTEPSDPAQDARLGEAIAAAGRVVLPVLPPMADQPGVPLPASLPPIAPIRRGAAGLGAATILPDADGVVRTVPPPPRGTIDLMTAAAWSATSIRETTTSQAPRRIPFGGTSAGWAEISAADIISGQVPDDAIRGHLVLVGVTATGLGSRYPTPAGRVMSGLEIQAFHLGGLLSGRMIRQAGLAGQLALALMPLCVMMGLLGPWRRLPSLAGVFIAVLLVLGTSAAALMGMRLWLPPGAALAGLGFAWPLWGWRQLALVEAFLHAQLQKLAREPALLPRAPLAPRGSGVSSTIALLHAAINANREMRHFVADRLDQLPDATLVTDLDGRVMIANLAAQRLFAGLGLEALAGAGATDLLAPFRETRRGERLPFPPSDPAGATYEAQIDAAHFHLVGIAPQTSADGTPSGWIIRFVDISDAKAAQRQRDDVIQLLTHDMRSPQASILAVLETAPPERIHAVEAGAIRHYAETTLRLADGFVQLARAENLDYVLEEVDLADMLIDAIDDLWPQSKAKAIGIATHTKAPGDLVVTAERSLLTRALVNVIGNAIKYSPAHSTITCTLDRETDTAGKPWALCTVTDQGPGIAPDLQARIYERFSRGPVGLGPKTSGAGLGLSFVHTVMVRHHGATRCISEPGQGATFILRLPITA